jgi:hypothetical protein
MHDRMGSLVDESEGPRAFAEELVIGSGYRLRVRTRTQLRKAGKEGLAMSVS